MAASQPGVHPECSGVAKGGAAIHRDIREAYLVPVDATLRARTWGLRGDGSGFTERGRAKPEWGSAGSCPV